MTNFTIYQTKYRTLNSLYVQAIFDYDRAETKKQRVISEKKQEILKSLLDKFIENEYSQVIFEYYSKSNPVLVDRYTGAQCTFKEAFGNDFFEVRKILRHSLVGLVEEQGKYMLKNSR